VERVVEAVLRGLVAELARPSDDQRAGSPKTAENGFDYSLHKHGPQTLCLRRRASEVQAKAAIDTSFSRRDLLAGLGVVYVLVHVGLARADSHSSTS